MENMQVSLKNVADLLDFATTYHADQLKSTCLQFICLNLPAVLEGNLLKNSTRESLDDIGRYYREFVSL